jgi:hypothetical protein
MDPRPGQYSTASSRPRLITSGYPAAHLLAVLQAQVAELLHSVPTEATYEYIVGALKGLSETTSGSSLPGATQSQDPAVR